MRCVVKSFFFAAWYISVHGLTFGRCMSISWLEVIQSGSEADVSGVLLLVKRGICLEVFSLGFGWTDKSISYSCFYFELSVSLKCQEELSVREQNSEIALCVFEGFFVKLVRQLVLLRRGLMGWR
jgi:hypothetical protein